MDDKKQPPLAPGAEIKTLEHHHAPVPGVKEGGEGKVTDAPRQLSWRALFTRQDNTAFFAEALDKYGYDGAISPEQEKRLVRKIDCLVLPCLAMCYAFYYIDKTTLSYAAIFGLKKPQSEGGLGLEGTDYSWLSSSFYFGWLAWAIPTNLIMQRSPTSTYLASQIFLWGVFLMIQASCKNFTELLVLRVLGGAVESIADPAFMLITCTFYTRAEQPSRISAWYAANGVGVAGGGLLGYCIGQIKSSLPSWKYEFLIIGALCALWGIVLLLVLPSNPATCMWFTREERLMAVARLRGNQTGIENKKFKWDQAREAFTDRNTWLFFLLGFIANIPNGGISNFSTLIFQGLGFDTLKTSLLGIPQGALVCIWIGLGAFLNGRLPANSRTIVCMLFMIPTIAGSLGFLLAPKDAYVGRLICFYLTGSWLGACVGNIAGPFFYKSNQAPSYRLGIGSMLVANCLEVAILLLLRLSFIARNKLRDRQLENVVGADGSKSEAVPHENETTFSDLTDGQNPNFRYVY
ncbi:major facilitator superfamily domain-containing protein [Leucosporidium creatinivorum]|uniref:Major facilitator superfamily domain-containing protein n=1 Tax=Leucosporidium creatinivorum TaxID=106004 RepID=A0A1Y2FZB8_9BASI|nr:major facilitator superfamily domain-containing protein [Leucosporidium creatinivorum]